HGPSLHGGTWLRGPRPAAVLLKARPLPGSGMGFEINVVSNTPLTPLNAVDGVALIFLTNVGYIPKGYDPKTDAKTIKQSVPYRLFMECFLGRVERGWTAEQLATELKTTNTE